MVCEFTNDTKIRGLVGELNDKIASLLYDNPQDTLKSIEKIIQDFLKEHNKEIPSFEVYKEYVINESEILTNRWRNKIIKRLLSKTDQNRDIDANSFLLEIGINAFKNPEEYNFEIRDESKIPDEQDQLAKLDNRRSYLDLLGPRNEQLKFISNITKRFEKLLYFTHDDFPIHNSEEFHDNIMTEIFNVAEELRNATKRLVDSNDLREKDDAEDITDFANRILRAARPLFEDNDVFILPQLPNYVILNKIDNVLKTVFGKSINIPNAYFNLISASKPKYTRNLANSMSTTWRADTKDDNYDDMQEISLDPKIIIENFNLYTIDNQDGQIVFRKSQSKIQFNSAVHAFSFLNTIVYDPSILPLLESVIGNDAKFSKHVKDNFNIFIYEKYIKNKSLRDIICSTGYDMSSLLPIILYTIFDYDNTNGNKVRGLSILLKNAINKIDPFALSTLYSLYENIYKYKKNNENPESLLEKEFGLESKLTDVINQLFCSLTYLPYASYEYNKESNTIVRKLLTSKFNRYAINSFVRQLNGKHRANDAKIEISNNDKESLRGKELKNNLVINVEFKLPNTTLKVLVYLPKSKSLFATKVIFGDNDLEVNLQDGKLLDDMNDPITYYNKILKYLQLILPINLNSSLRNIIENNTYLKTAIVETFFDVLNHKIANEIENNIYNGKSEVDNDEFYLSGSRFGDETEAMPRYKRWFSKPKFRKNSLLLELMTASSSIYLDAIVGAIADAEGIVRSQMVEDSLRLQLNQSKLWQAGNAFMQLTVDLRSDKNNPGSSFAIYDVFNGCVILRDFVDKNGKVTSKTDMTAIDLFKTSFFTDYLGGFHESLSSIAFTGAVVSDKSYIYRILSDKNKKIKYNIDAHGNLSKLSNRYGITVGKMLTHQNSSNLIRQFIRFELGDYYGKQYDFVTLQVGKLNNVVSGQGRSIVDKILGLQENDVIVEELSLPLFDIHTNYYQFNLFVNKELILSKIEEQLLIAEQLPNTDDIIQRLLNAKEILSSLSNKLFKELVLHHILLKDESIEFIEPLIGYFDKNNNLCVNPLVIENLFKYNTGRYKIENDTVNSLEYIFLSKYWKDKIEILDDKFTFNYNILEKEDAIDSLFITDILRSKISLNSYSTDLILKRKESSGNNGPEYDGDQNILGKTMIQKITPWLDPNYLNRIALMKLYLSPDDEIGVNIYNYNSLLRTEVFSEAAKISRYFLSKQKLGLPPIILLYALILNIDNSEFDIVKAINFINSSTYTSLKNKYNELINTENISDDIFLSILLDSNAELEYYISFEFNNILTDYNQISLLLGEEYLNALVGTYLNHPIKGNTINEIRKNCIGAQVKRNVTLSATKHRYYLNLLDTIPDTINIAIVDNLSDYVYNLSGDELSNGKPKEQLSDDGAMRVEGSFAIQENASLKSAAVGTDKKLFGGMVNAKSGTGFIDKCAGFVLTCDKIRSSEIDLIINKKMKGKKWLTEGEVFYNVIGDSKGELTWYESNFIDITHDYLGRLIDYSSMNIYYAIPIYNEENNDVEYEYYKITDVSVDYNTGETIVTRQRVTIHGEDYPGINPEELRFRINSNYDLWQNVLGGMFSCKMQNIDDDNVLTFENCNRSHEHLAKLANLIGLYLGERVSSRNELQKLATSQSSVNLILKTKNICYVATEGAVKQGVTNRNTVDAMLDPNYELTTMKMKTTDLGVLLDSEHSAEHKTISLITQVINALAARGYSVDEANEVYDALYRIAMVTISDILQGYTSTATDEDRESAADAIAKIIINSFKRLKVSAADIYLSIITGIRTSKNKNVQELLKQYVPVDHPYLFRKIISDLSVAILGESIREKMGGNQLVLVPSNGEHRLYDGKTLDQFGSPEIKDKILEKKFLERLSPVTAAKYTWGKLKEDGKKNPFKKVFTSDGREVYIKSAIQSINRKGYSDDAEIDYFSEKQGEDPYRITSGADIELGKTYRYIINITPEGQVVLSDEIKMDSPIDRWNFIRDILPNYKVYEYLPAGYDLGCELAIIYGDIVDNEGNVLLENTKFSIWDLNDVHRKWGAQINKEDDRNLNAIQRDIQKLLLIIGDTKDGDILSFYNEKDPDNPIKVKIDRSKTELIAFGAIAPKIFKTQYGLDHGDKLSDIENDEYFFLRKNARKIIRLKNKNIPCDVTLVGTEYSRNFILSEPDRMSDILIPKGYTENLWFEYVVKNQKVYRIDPISGNIMYELPSKIDPETLETKPNVRIFKNDNNDEIIVTDNLNYFIDQRLHTNINLYSINDENKFNLLKSHLETNKIRHIKDIVTNTMSDNQTYNRIVNEYYNELNSILEDEEHIFNSNDNIMLSSLENAALKLHGSFLDTLYFVAARTPAQCQQSFMSMKIVGFSTNENNAIYVSRWQLWLQGSKK